MKQLRPPSEKELILWGWGFWDASVGQMQDSVQMALRKAVWMASMYPAQDSGINEALYTGRLPGSMWKR
jgi:hypothetical protein